MIFLVEDDDNIRELVTYTLQSASLPCEGFSAPSAFWKRMREEIPSLVLLDIMLPEQDGLSILKQLRADAAFASVPIIMLTAKGSEMDKVRGLEMGADDYIAKPFGVMELLARVKARLRTQQTEKVKEYTVGALYVCPKKHIVQVNGENVTLTLKEFEALCYLLLNRGMVLTRDQILNAVWGYAFDGESRTVDVHVRTLRQKLGDAGSVIETVRGIGYKIGG